MTNKKDLMLTRIFDAPRKDVFQYWIDPNLMAKWWGPKGFITPVSQLDVRPGGQIYLVMEDLEGLIKKGSRYPMRGTFVEIDEPSKIVYESQALMDDKPIIDNTTTITFKETVDKMTKMILRIAVTRATPEAEMPLRGMEVGWSQSFEKLSELLQKNV